MTKRIKVLSWAVRIVAAVILLQTLYFKFGGAEESIYIFSKLGVEPAGRYASGIMELIASILLLWPRTVWLGAILGLGIMAGAIAAHLTILGVVVMDDGGYLFGLGVLVFVCCAAALAIHWQQLPLIHRNSRSISPRA